MAGFSGINCGVGELCAVFMFLIAIVTISSLVVVPFALLVRVPVCRQVSVCGGFMFPQSVPNPLSIFLSLPVSAFFLFLPFPVLVDSYFFQPFLCSCTCLCFFSCSCLCSCSYWRLSSPFDIPASVYNTVHVPVPSSAPALVSVNAHVNLRARFLFTILE